jgi:hypothetical protein
MKKLWIFLFIMTLTAGCLGQSPATSSDADKAQSTLVDFFELLNTRKYQDAVPLYGESYELLQSWNPGVDPSDTIALWKWACESNGLQCLKIRTAILLEEQDDILTFQVEFNNPDGSLFVRGPCCGASETEMPPQSQFEYRISKTADGKFLVMDLPPYVP